MHNNKKGKRILSWVLAAAVVAAGIPAQASGFDAVSVSDLFTSGPEDIWTDGSVESGTAENPTEPPADTSPVPTPEGTPVPTPTGAPGEMITPEPTVTPEETPTPIPTETPEPTVTPTVTPEPTVTPTPTPTPAVIPEGMVLVKFADSSGTNYYEELQRMINWGDLLELPDVPDAAVPEGNRWKLEKDKKADDTLFIFDGGENVSVSQDENWEDYMEDKVLTFYAAKKCKINLYNNSGTAVFPGGNLEAYEGESIILPDMPNSKYINYGWTSVKGGRDVEQELNSVYRVSWDTDLYIIRYTAQTVTFLHPSGVSTSSVSKLNLRVKAGEKIRLPEVPGKAGYECLGWSLKKNDTAAAYKTGKTVTVKTNLVFYAVRKKLPYSVTFNNKNGTSTSKAYTSLTKYAKKNQTIVLPEVPKLTGYQGLGWTTEKGSTEPLYEAGDSVRVTKNMKFYAVHRKSSYYTVQFYTTEGKTSTSYKKLSVKVEEGTTITFPRVPARSGYINLGWSGKKNAAKPSSNTSYTVKRNVKFYAVQVKAVKVTLHKVNGDVSGTVTMQQGSAYTLPCVTNAPGYTFMGWSDRPGQSVKPKYEAEMSITVKENMDLYAVVFSRKDEEDIPASQLPAMDYYKYKKVIFVGDSRTVYLHNMLNTVSGQSGINLTKGIEFVGEAGCGLDWFRTSSAGYAELMKKVGNGSISILEKPTAVIFNLGVNDLRSSSSNHYNDYVLYMNSIATVLEKKGCKLFYTSLNPINRKMLKTDRSEAGLRVFNNNLRRALPRYTYIDTYSMLKATGFGFDTGKGFANTGVDDGLHYTMQTYKKIFRQCMNAL